MSTPNRRDERLERYRRYVQFIEKCCEHPGSRAALWSGLRRTPERSPRMHSMVTPWLGDAPKSAEERAFYTVAALIAGQPRSGRDDTARTRQKGDTHTPDEQTGPVVAGPRRGRSLGRSMADFQSALHTRSKPASGGADTASGRSQPDDSATHGPLSPLERRLHALTRQSIDGVHRDLPAIVLRLRGDNVPVDWAQMLADLARWPAERDHISKRWLQDFYRYRDLPATGAEASTKEPT